MTTVNASYRLLAIIAACIALVCSSASLTLFIVGLSRTSESIAATDRLAHDQHDLNMVGLVCSAFFVGNVIWNIIGIAQGRAPRIHQNSGVKPASGAFSVIMLSLPVFLGLLALLWFLWNGARFEQSGTLMLGLASGAFVNACAWWYTACKRGHNPSRAASPSRLGDSPA